MADNEQVPQVMTWRDFPGEVDPVEPVVAFTNAINAGESPEEVKPARRTEKKEN